MILLDEKAVKGPPGPQTGEGVWGYLIFWAKFAGRVVGLIAENFALEKG